MSRRAGGRGLIREEGLIEKFYFHRGSYQRGGVNREGAK